MHALETAGVAYADPWLQPLDERLRMLARGQRRVAYYYEAANNSTFRYRAYNMVQVLGAEAGEQVGASYFFHTDREHFAEIAAQADVLVICRSGYDDTVAALLAHFRARHRPVIFDVDDLVFDTEYVHLIMNTLAVPTHDSAAWPHWFHYLGSMGATLRQCDAGITTNDFLARRMAAFSGKPVAVVPNFMNREQLALSAQVYEEKRRRGFAGDGSIVLGYFSGSPSHTHDYAIVEPALAALLAADERVRVMVVGYIDAGPQLAPFNDRIIRQPFHDYVNLQRLVGTVEFSLAPLQRNAFTDGKSPLKVFEASAVGTLSIASPSWNYADVVQDGENGYLARAHEWERRLRHAIGNLPRYAAMAERAHDEALRRFSWQHQRAAIERALGWG
jgi:glycosyltransferase involved in cell wall biosynthesis